MSGGGDLSYSAHHHCAKQTQSNSIQTFLQTRMGMLSLGAGWFLSHLFFKTITLTHAGLSKNNAMMIMSLKEKVVISRK